MGVFVGRMFDGVPKAADAGSVGCADENGGVNTSGDKGIINVMVLLGHLFLADPRELAPLCETHSKNQ